MTSDNFDRPLSSCFKVKKDTAVQSTPSPSEPINKPSESYKAQIDSKSRILSMSVYRPKNYKKKLILAGAVITAQIILYLIVVLQPDTVIETRDGKSKETISAQSAQIVTIASTRLAIAGFKEKYARAPSSINELVPEFLPGAPYDPVSKEAIIFDPQNMQLRLASAPAQAQASQDNKSEENKSKILYTFPKEKTVSLVVQNSFDKIKYVSNWEILAGLPAMMKMTLEPTELIHYMNETEEFQKIEISDWVFQREEKAYFAAKAQARIFTRNGENTKRGLANAYLRGSFTAEKGLQAELYLTPIQGSVESQLSAFKDIKPNFFETVKVSENTYSVRAYIQLEQKP